MFGLEDLDTIVRISLVNVNKTVCLRALGHSFKFFYFFNGSYNYQENK